MEDIERLSSEELVSDYVQDKRKELSETVTWNLAVEDIFTREQLTIDQEELKREVDRVKEQMIKDKLEYNEELLEGESFEQLKILKVMAWLQTKMKIEVEPWTGDPASSNTA